MGPQWGKLIPLEVYNVMLWSSIITLTISSLYTELLHGSTSTVRSSGVGNERKAPSQESSGGAPGAKYSVEWSMEFGD